MGRSKFILLYVGLALFVPGLAALCYSLWNGAVAWTLDEHALWMTPIGLFIFFLLLSYVGAFLSSAFHSLNVPLDKRTSLLAELSSFGSLVMAAAFPVARLGFPNSFSMPDFFSPLVWNFYSIAVYGFFFLLYFAVHLKAVGASGAVDGLSAASAKSFVRWHKPMAWLLFPLVIWTHAVVGISFISSFAPLHRGSFLPVYLMAVALLAGLALVNSILIADGYRMRLLERLLMVASWFMMVVWGWCFLIRGNFCASSFVFAGVLPQLYWVERVRDSKMGRLLLYLSVLLGMLLECIYLVAPSEVAVSAFTFAMPDVGLILLSVGGFMLLFFGASRLLGARLENEGAYFGEVDGSDMVAETVNEVRYVAPWSSVEFRLLRLPMIVGALAAVFISILIGSLMPVDSLQQILLNLVPLFFPSAALTIGLYILVRLFVVERYLVCKRRRR